MAKRRDPDAAFLVDLLRYAPPRAATPAEALTRLQAIQTRLAELALDAADEKYPGFRALMDTLARDELRLRSAGQRAH